MGSCKADTPAEQETPATVAAVETPAEQAVAQLTKLLEQRPNDPVLLAQRGEIYYENRIYDRAAADLVASIEADSSRPEVWHLLADAQLDGLRSRDALNTMIFASSQFPDRMGTLLKLAEYQYILQQYEDALATLDRAAKLDINEGEVFFMIGQVLSESGDTMRAINAYQRATELKPQLLDAWLSLGVLHEMQGNQIAERYFNTATEIDRTNPLPFRMRADFYLRQNRLEEAIAGYDETIGLDPRQAEAFYNSGLALLELDQVDPAKEQFDRAIEISPTYAVAYFYRGVALELQGNLQEARNSFQQAVNLNPNYAAAQEALSRLSSVK